MLKTKTGKGLTLITTTNTTALDFLLLVLEVYAFYQSVHYVARYWTQMVGKDKIPSRFLRNVWESEIALALVFLTLIWVSVNSIFGIDTFWLSYSADMRKVALILSIFYIIHIKLNQRDIWDYSKRD